MTRPRLIMTLLVRDEADIVADNVAWHLSQGVDHVIATDNGSTDGTREALARFAREGVLTLLDEPSTDYLQDAWQTRMALMARDEMGADWVFCNDADEFWRSPSGDLHDALPDPSEPARMLVCQRRNMIAPRDALGGHGARHWSETLTLRPVAPPPLPRPADTLSGLRDLRLDAPYFEHAVPPKLLLPTRNLRAVARGAHKADYEGEAPGRADAPIEILHFPVRSRAEFAASVHRIGGAMRRVPDPKVSWKYRRWLQMAEESGSIWPAFREALPDRRQVRAGLASGRLMQDRTFAHALRRLPHSPSSTPAARTREEPAMTPALPETVPPKPPRHEGGRLTLVTGPDAHAVATCAGLLERRGAAAPRAQDHEALAALHEAMLAETGCAPHDPKPAPADATARAAGFDDTLHETLLAAYDDLDAAVLGDARLCRLLPRWQAMAQGRDIGLGLVLVVPDPLTTAADIRAATGLPEATGLVVWAARLIDAERHSRDLPRHVVLEADVLDDWAGTAAAIEAALAPGWLPAHRAEGPEIDAFLAGRGRAAPATEAALIASPRVPDLVRETLEAMQALAAGAEPAALAPEFDRIGADLDAAARLLGPALDDLLDRQSRWHPRLARAERTAEIAERRAEDAAAEIRWLRQALKREWLHRHEAEERRAAQAEQPARRADIRALPRQLKARLKEHLQIAMLRAAPEFDADWYRRRYPDVAAQKVDPARHYLRHGAREGRHPGPGFDTRRYYDAYPGVRKAGQNALLHYRRHGRKEGRKAFPVEPRPA
ncbi:glycosyltransferase family 2 protein [Limimaricola pyoseonensis]|uniref:Glycosyl transferase family 2 n=1 Tax=Limimaricola pyoseonensis TaxID=521013 RepID=A0A1G7KIH9_9RHOB|nr:glycosyltransferase family 2 protein [Limimaricola pyoseonensis]SDF36891.1 hypothetical protein SAMN04488567_0209 [Limimaricola pyoseonensis]